MINCNDFMAEFADFLEDHVSPEVRQQLEQHLARCRACNVLYDSTRKTLKIVTESGAFELPGDVSQAAADRIIARLRREKPPGSE